MRDHILICGYGATGQAAAAELLKRGEQADDIVIVDNDPSAIEAATEAGFVTVVGDATQSAVLHEAGAVRARSVVVAPNRDDTAVLITLTVRELNETAHIVAGGRERENLHLLRQGGANEVIDATAAVGRMIGLATITPEAVRVVDDLLDSGTGLDLLEVSPVAGPNGLCAPGDATIVAVLRGGKRLPSKELIEAPLRLDDRLIVLTEPA